MFAIAPTKDNLMNTYPGWLRAQIAGICRARRLAQYARYRASAKGRAACRRHNAERSARCYWRDYRETHREQTNANSRACRARRKAYLEELFADAPEKRVYL